MRDPDNPAPVFDALPIPETALDQGGVEVLRAAIVQGGLHVSLRPAFDEPDVWGVLLADLARHAARVFAQEKKFTEEDALDRICGMFHSEMNMPTDLGTTRATARGEY